MLLRRTVNGHARDCLSQVSRQPPPGDGAVLRSSADEYPALRNMWSRLDARLAGAVLGRDDVVRLEVRSAALMLPHTAHRNIVAS